MVDVVERSEVEGAIDALMNGQGIGMMPSVDARLMHEWLPVDRQPPFGSGLSKVYRVALSVGRGLNKWKHLLSRDEVDGSRFPDRELLSEAAYALLEASPVKIVEASDG